MFLSHNTAQPAFIWPYMFYVYAKVMEELGYHSFID